MRRQPFPVRLCIALAAMAAAAPGAAQTPVPIVQPGAPGEASRLLSAEDASRLVGVQYIEADVRFVQDMIAHHAQALEMTALVADRTERGDVRQVASRIERSQADEIRTMRQWLRERNQEETSAGHVHPGPGMLTDEEMSRLRQATGVEFEQLFLELMIKHHRGAVTMVEALFDEAGSAQDAQLFSLTADILSDQTAEIERMATLRATLSPDPRIGLRAGFRDAGEAAWNLELVAAIPKPDGFFDPEAPAGLPNTPAPRPTPRPRRAANEPASAAQGAQGVAQAPAAGAERAERTGDDDGEGEGEEDGPRRGRAEQRTRPGLLSFANSDIAFAGSLVIAGNYHGFNAYDAADPAAPRLVVSVVCPGGQGDVSVYGNLLFMSVEQTRGRLDCGLQGVAERASDARFRGIRVFDISDIRMPRQVAAVQTCRGSHTHTIVNDPGETGTLYIYGSGAAGVRPTEELSECSDANPAADPNTARFSIDVIAVPLAAPEQARVVARPRIFADPLSGAIAGLWRGGDHGTDTQRTSETNHCHDITAFPEIGLAAGACSGNGILLDISDPVNPVRLDQVVDARFAYWHSATFNHDGTKLIFTDEWGGGSQPRCRASDPMNWGANAIFEIVDRRLQFRSYFKMPAAQTEQENCVAHNGSLVPVPGRDIMVQAWYQGGISVFDFTDPSRPEEIAFFDRGPIDAERMIMGGYWSAYWHNGAIYGTEISRGLDVLRLLPSDRLSQHEIAAAAAVTSDRFNPQQQRRVEWPAAPVVARAYLDQLARSGALPPDRVQTVTAALDGAENLPAGGAGRDAAAARLDTVAAQIETDSARAAGQDRTRFRSLAETMSRIAATLRSGKP